MDKDVFRLSHRAGDKTCRSVHSLLFKQMRKCMLEGLFTFTHHPMHQIRKFFIDAFQIDIPLIHGDGTEQDPYHLQLTDLARNGYYAELFATCWFRSMEAAIKRAIRWKIADRGMTPGGHYRLIIQQWIDGTASFSVESLHFSCEPDTKAIWAPAIIHDDYLVVPQKLGGTSYLGLRNHEAEDPGTGYAHGWRTEGFAISIYVYSFDGAVTRSTQAKKAGVSEQIKLAVEGLPPAERKVTEIEGPSWMPDHAQTVEFNRDGIDGRAYGIVSVSYKHGLFFKVRVTMAGNLPRAVINDSMGSIKHVFERLYREGPGPSFDPQGWLRSLTGKQN